MKKFIKIFILSILVSAGFVFFVRADVLRKVPGFQCESFGCQGLGLVYFLLALALIPLAFGTVAFFSSKENRLKQGMAAFGISWVMMLGSLFVIYAWNQADIRRDTEEGDRAMREMFQRLNIPDRAPFREHNLFNQPPQ